MTTAVKEMDTPVPFMVRVVFGGVLLSLLIFAELKLNTLIYMLVVTALYLPYLLRYMSKHDMRSQKMHRLNSVMPMVFVAGNVVLFIIMPLYVWIVVEPPWFYSDTPIFLLSFIYSSLYGCYETIDRAILFYSTYIIPYIFLNIWIVNKVRMNKYVLLFLPVANGLIVCCWYAMVWNSSISVLRVVGE